VSKEGSKPRILLTGKTGQVGSALVPLLDRMGQLTALDRRELDLGKPEQIRRAVRAVRPELIVNAAAYTAVDRAESDGATAQAINSAAPAVLAEEAKRLGALLVHYSTDYVFDGTKRSPYVEDDPLNPLNVYGKTKLAGERAIQEIGPPHLIFRASWVYAPRGRNFLLTVLRLATEKEELRIVRDQTGAPTSSQAIAAATCSVLSKIRADANSLQSRPEAKCIYHMTAGGETSWYGFAELILELASSQSPARDWLAAATSHRPLMARRIVPISTEEFPTPARRPAYSVLANRKLNETFGVRLPHWQEQLRAVFSDRGEAYIAGTVEDRGAEK
jgi:dTDP-4-dehydrorhamnose reductase